MNDRIKKVVARLDTLNIDAFLVTKDINVQYLTQNPSEESFLLIHRKKVFYFTDGRYALKAQKALTDIKVICVKESFWKELAGLIISLRINKLGLNENHVNVSQYKRLKSFLRGKVTVRGINGLVEGLRAIKDDAEILAMRRALTVHKQAHSYLKRVLKPGLTEEDIAKRLEAFVRRRDCVFSFPPIIASGVNSCYPHARVTTRKVHANDIILVDMGIEYNGYKSDLTRMFFLGRIAKSIRRIHDFVHQAQQKSIQKIKAGIPISELDKTARTYLKQQGIGDYFSHSLGHGVGLEVHETPRVSSQNQDVLKENMVITIEPGIYVPDQFGIRLEEMVRVTQEGCEVLSDNID